MTDHGGVEGALSHVEPMGQRAEVEPRAWRPNVELGDPHTKAELEIGEPKADPSSWTEPLKKKLQG